MIGLIGAGIGAIGSVYGAIKAGKARKEMGRMLDKQEADNEAWYRANVYGDFTQRADSQAIINNMRKTLAERAKRDVARNAVMGATAEVQANARSAGNDALAKTYSNLASMGQRYRDGVTSAYLARKDSINAQRSGMQRERAVAGDMLLHNGIMAIGNGLNSIGAGTKGA